MLLYNVDSHVPGILEAEHLQCAIQKIMPAPTAISNGHRATQWLTGQLLKLIDGQV